VFDSVDAIPHLAPVAIIRAKNPISPLIVRPHETLLRPPPNRPPWNEPVIALHVALTLWQDDVLARWYATNKPAVPPAKRGIALQPDGTPYSPMMQGAAHRYASPDTVEAVDAEYDKVTNKLKKKAAGASPSTNGHSPPKG
jgi:hypothetical protein